MARKSKMSRCARWCLNCACLAVSVVVAGCAQNAESLAPSSPSQPWTPGNTAGSSLLPRSDAGHGPAGADSSGRDFSVLGNPAVAELPPPPQTQAGKVYQLPELIDIAARNNPVTRIAWEQAR